MESCKNPNRTLTLEACLNMKQVLFLILYVSQTQNEGKSDARIQENSKIGHSVCVLLHNNFLFLVSQAYQKL